jgi:hypothetical protein
MPISTIGEWANAIENGKYRIFTWRKAPSQVTTTGIWFDLSMSPGNPSPQYYAAAPLSATVMSQSSDGGLFHGGNVTPDTKNLHSIMALATAATALPMPMILCDYLMFYSFIDEGVTDEQVMTNTNVLTRYTDGAGVEIMPVVVGAHSLAAGVTFTVKYTNQNGVTGRVTSVHTLTTAQAVNGTIATCERANSASIGPFMNLQEGDTGVRAIESATFSVTDVGLIALVLVKPLMQMQIRGIDAPVEKVPRIDHSIMPAIMDNAYLNWICLPAGSLAATTIHGTIETVWG